VIGLGFLLKLPWLTKILNGGVFHKFRASFEEFFPFEEFGNF